VGHRCDAGADPSSTVVSATASSWPSRRARPTSSSPSSAVDDPAHGFARAGRKRFGIVELTADEHPVGQDDQDVGGRVGIGMSIGDEQIPQEVAVPATVLLDRPPNGAGRVRVLGGGVQGQAAAVARLTGRGGESLEDRVEHRPWGRAGDRGHGGAAESILVFDVGPDEVVLGREVLGEGRLGHPPRRANVVAVTLSVRQPSGSPCPARRSPGAARPRRRGCTPDAGSARRPPCP
jgi:hypothetical protein